MVVDERIVKMADDTFKATKVIEYVQPSPRKWENPKGADLFFISVNFSDGTEGSVGSIESKVTETQDSLNALKGQAFEFELKAGKEYNGIQQFKLYDWPGKPSGLGGSGGGRGGGGGMSHSQAGYMAAASVLGPVIAQEMAMTKATVVDALIASRVVAMGELITEALFTRQPKQETEEKKEEASPVPAAVSVTLAQLKALRELIASKGWTVEQACGSLGIKALTDLTEEQAGEALQLWGE
jgi:hypothetical protein